MNCLLLLTHSAAPPGLSSRETQASAAESSRPQQRDTGPQFTIEVDLSQALSYIKASINKTFNTLNNAILFTKLF